MNKIRCVVYCKFNHILMINNKYYNLIEMSDKLVN